MPERPLYRFSRQDRGHRHQTSQTNRIPTPAGVPLLQPGSSLWPVIAVAEPFAVAGLLTEPHSAYEGLPQFFQSLKKVPGVFSQAFSSMPFVTFVLFVVVIARTNAAVIAPRDEHDRVGSLLPNWRQSNGKPATRTPADYPIDVGTSFSRPSAPLITWSDDGYVGMASSTAAL